MTKTQQAIKHLKRLHPKPGVAISDKEYKNYETDCAVFVILNYEAILKADHWIAKTELEVAGSTAA